MLDFFGSDEVLDKAEILRKTEDPSDFEGVSSIEQSFSRIRITLIMIELIAKVNK